MAFFVRVNGLEGNVELDLGAILDGDNGNLQDDGGNPWCACGADVSFNGGQAETDP